MASGYCHVDKAAVFCSKEVLKCRNVTTVKNLVDELTQKQIFVASKLRNYFSETSISVRNIRMRVNHGVYKAQFLSRKNSYFWNIFDV